MGHSEDEVVKRIKLAPDAGLVNALGANHTLESAIADLVDNSIDADATRVSIRLLTADDRLVQVEVVDNGFGMDDVRINKAMTIGHQRDYKEDDLGHFGMGLKAASFGHSDVLTVWSSKRGADPAGRRIKRADFSKDFTCEVLSGGSANVRAAERKEIVASAQGTTIVWTHLRNTYRGRSPEEAAKWLSSREAALRSHLGVTFHKLLADRRLEIDVLTDDLKAGELEPGVPVMPINPFSYAGSGHPDYPKSLVAKVGSRKIKLTCHIWPPKLDITGFRIGEKSGDHFQGFYIYRHDRLLQLGGWADTANASPSRQLARVEIDDGSAIGKFLAMNPEKSSLKFEASFHDAINRASAADGTTFADYLEDAELVYATSKKRNRERKPVIQPDKGFAPAVRRRVGAELESIGESVSTRWKQLPKGEFFQVDLREKMLWLNQRYRSWFVPYNSGGNDAPLLKALMYLLTHHVFEGQVLGARDKDDIALWKSILNAAIKAEEQMRDKEAVDD